MEKKQYNLCLEVLRRFEQHGLLKEFILIGSWAVFFYEYYFNDVQYTKRLSLITRDMDFLIDRPSRIKSKVNIPDLLKDLGFLTSFVGREGYIQLTHPELMIEFLTPERGRGVDKPCNINALGVNATALRFLNFLTEKSVVIKVENLTLCLPHPANFALHKLLISQRRRQVDKRKKDIQSAVFVLKELLAHHKSAVIKRRLNQMPKKWQQTVYSVASSVEDPDIRKLFI